MSAAMAERVFELLPADGKRVYYGQLVALCGRRLHLSAGFAGALIGVLCTKRRAAVELDGGHDFVRRLPELPDFPLVPRPLPPAPPRPRARQSTRPAPTLGPLRAGTLVLRRPGTLVLGRPGR
jgi:hypothetical protein